MYLLKSITFRNREQHTLYTPTELNYVVNPVFQKWYALVVTRSK